MQAPSNFHANSEVAPVSASGLDQIPNRTPDQAREDIARKDRATWYSDGSLRILTSKGRIVSEHYYASDRDAILTMARSHDAMKAALESAKEQLTHTVPADCWATGPLTGNVINDLIACPGCAVLAGIEAALKLARGGKS